MSAVAVLIIAYPRVLGPATAVSIIVATGKGAIVAMAGDDFNDATNQAGFRLAF